MPSKKSQSKKFDKSDLDKYADLTTTVDAPFAVNCSNTRGKHSLATRIIKAGEIIYTEQAYTLIVAHPAKSDFCHYCVEPMPVMEVMGEDGQLKIEHPTLVKGDDTSDIVVYCSQKCCEDDTENRKISAPILSQLVELAAKNNINLDLLRLILGLLTRKVRQEAGETIQSDSKLSPWFCIEDLVVHREAFDKAWMKNMIATAKDLSVILPAEMALEPQQIVDFACRINSNAHSMQDTEGKTQVAAFGLFPLGSLFFRHSCLPNIHFSGDKGQFSYRAVKDIQVGQELVVSHVADLYSPRSERQRELQISKFLRCDCPRCKPDLKKSVDRFIDGILCSACQTSVVLPVAATKADGTPDYPFFRCEDDACGHELTYNSFLSKRAKMMDEYRANIETINANKFPEAVAALKSWIQKYGTEKYIHSMHCLLLNTRVNLLNVLTVVQEYEEAVKINREVISTYENSGIIPPNWPDVAELYNNLGELLLQHARNPSKPSKPAITPKTEEKDKKAATPKGDPRARRGKQFNPEEEKKASAPSTPRVKKPASAKLAGAPSAADVNRIHKQITISQARAAFTKAGDVASVVFGSDSKKALDFRAKVGLDFEKLLQ